MSWRLLIDEAADGATNMAVDEALLDSARLPGALPTVRLYRFSSPTLTFGYAQDLSRVVDEPRCRALGIECVRRITGGRALLHQHELTFSVTAPTHAPFPHSVKSTYQLIRSTIARAIGGLGVPVDDADSASAVDPRRAPGDLPCLAVPTGHEITVGGRKIVAASMRWRRQSFLVHGSILWAVDRTLWRAITRAETAGELTAAGIRNVAPAPIVEARLVEALTSSFEELLGASPRRDPLTREEAQRVRKLVQKYRSARWTGRLEVPVTSS